MTVRLSDHFTYPRLLRFVAPSVAMMMVTSVYSIVDGFFISNIVGKNAFAAVNLIMPLLAALGAFGFMIGTGGAALVSLTLGQGQPLFFHVDPSSGWNRPAFGLDRLSMDAGFCPSVRRRPGHFKRLRALWPGSHSGHSFFYATK